MSSSDDEARQSSLGASSSKHAVPVLDSKDSHDEDELPQNKQRMGDEYGDWRTVIRFSKGDDAIMGEDEMQLRILAACNQLMDDARMVRLAGHVPAPTDVGLWKLKTEFTIDSGRTRVRWLECPMLSRCRCRCQIKIFDGPAYCLLEMRGNHHADSHVPLKQADKHAPRKDEHITLYADHALCHEDMVRKYGHSYARCFESQESVPITQAQRDALMDEINAATSEEDVEMNAIEQAALSGNMQPRDEFLARYERAGKEARTKRMQENSSPAKVASTTTSAHPKRKCRSSIPRIQVSRSTSSSECSDDYESEEDCFWDPLIAAIPELRRARDKIRDPFCLSPRGRRNMAEAVIILIVRTLSIRSCLTLLAAGS